MLMIYSGSVQIRTLLALNSSLMTRTSQQLSGNKQKVAQLRHIETEKCLIFISLCI